VRVIQSWVAHYARTIRRPTARRRAHHDNDKLAAPTSEVEMNNQLQYDVFVAPSKPFVAPPPRAAIRRLGIQ
jgi:hypothetical protein